MCNGFYMGIWRCDNSDDLPFSGSCFHPYWGLRRRRIQRRCPPTSLMALAVGRRHWRPCQRRPRRRPHRHCHPSAASGSPLATRRSRPLSSPRLPRPLSSPRLPQPPFSLEPPPEVKRRLRRNSVVDVEESSLRNTPEEKTSKLVAARTEHLLIKYKYLQRALRMGGGKVFF